MDIQNLTLEKYYFDCVTNTLFMSPKFYKRAGQYNSEEYVLLQIMRKEIPGLRLQVAAKKNRKTPTDGHLSIKAMRRYIELTREKEALLKELENVIAANSVKEHSLKETRKWFKERFPNYNSVPRFDKDGYLITEENTPESPDPSANQEEDDTP